MRTCIPHYKPRTYSVLIDRPFAVSGAVRADLSIDFRANWVKFGRWARDSVNEGLVNEGLVKQGLVKEWIDRIF